jgi:photosystem II stability/assembly factor-like uncharacterized protein
MLILVATDREVVVVDVQGGASSPAHGIAGRPTCLTADPLVHGRAWCGTNRNGVFRTDDGGRSWQSVGLAGSLIMAVSASPTDRDVVWVGTEPSEVWRSGDAGLSWEQTSPLQTLSSSSGGPFRRDRILITFAGLRAIRSNQNDCGSRSKAGALVSTIDGGRTWRDRVAGGPWDTARTRRSPRGARYTARLGRGRLFRE